MEKVKRTVSHDEVTKDKLAISVGSGTLEVYSTPMVVALMENASMNLAKLYISDNCTTVGTKINIEHISATPKGALVWAEATLEEFDGRKFTFKVEAFDQKGLIAHGEHIRFSVVKEHFQNRTNSKFDK